jgi:hypothetical protein
MENKKQNTIIYRLWRWLEKRFKDTDLKLDHIIFRLRDEDPRIYKYYSGKEWPEDDDDIEDLRDI